MRSIGLPELAVILALAVTGVVALVMVIRRSAGGVQASWSNHCHCSACGHTLMQPPDAPFCAYCGKKLA